MAIAASADIPDNNNMPTAEGLTPPASLSAEQAVLGGIMLNEQALDSLDVRLSPDDFYDNRHKLIFEAIKILRKQHKNIDMVTCAARLEATGQLENAGNSVYLAELTENIGTIANVPSYAEIVKNCSILRRLIQAGSEIMQNSYRAQGRDSDEIIDEAERIIYAIGESEANISAPQHISIGRERTMAHIEELMANKSDLIGLATGYPQLDRLIGGLTPGDLLIVAARPGCGKTAFALNMVNSLLDNEQTSGCLFFSLEMSTEPVIMRLLANRAAVRHDLLRAGRFPDKQDEDYLKVSDAALSMADSGLFIDETQGLTVSEIRSRIRRVCREVENRCKMPLKAVFVDYLQLIHTDSRRKRYENRATEISEVSRTLKVIAKEFNVAVIAMSQLNRSIEARADKTPMLSDLRESGSIEQDADIIMFLHNPKNKPSSNEGQDEDADNQEDRSKPHRIDILVRKNRNGRTGKVPTTFVPDLQRFEIRSDNSLADYDAQYQEQFDTE